jgi:DNA-directed RNA polymerase I subunit RPA1
MHPAEVEAQLKRSWELDPFLFNCLFGTGPSMNKDGYKMYFLRAIPVPPSRFRPPMHLNGMSVEHSQTQYLSKMISLNELLRTQFASGDEERAYTTWIELQTNVNCFMDSSKYPGASATNQVAPGIRQILERKEGLFRKNMMGKRVDYACRSVISPDPYVGTNEIGLPRYFATVLTYPTPVTDLNIKEMRELVERGVEYPGARWVEIAGKRVDLSKMKKHKREAIAAQLLTHTKKGGMPALVGRQLRDGDYVLMNRQVCVWFASWLKSFVPFPMKSYPCHAPLRNA